jgi:hypothetical protein
MIKNTKQIVDDPAAWKGKTSTSIDPNRKWSVKYGDLPTDDEVINAALMHQKRNLMFEANEVDPQLFSDIGNRLDTPQEILDEKYINPKTGKIQSLFYRNRDDEDVFELFNNEERLTERKFMKGNQWIKTQNWRYREDGALLEESESTSQVVGRSFYKKSTFYKVDNNGNWIEMYSTDSEGAVYNLNKRSIEYYEQKMY